MASKTREMYAGFVWGIEANAGLLVLKIRNGSTPRLNQPYFLSVVLNPKTPPREWAITYQQFREKHHDNYYQGLGSTFTPISYWKTDGDFTYYLCEVFDDQFIMNLEKHCFSKSVRPLVLVAEADPPLNYLVNLKEFLESNRENKIVNYVIDDRSTWNPQNLDNSQDVTPFIIQQIAENQITLIQGPPGTGKSYIAAAIANEHISRNKSVVICSLANKGLMEIIQQPTLKPALDAGKVFKTNVSSLERKQNPHLNKRREIIPVRGELLLTSYYALSSYFREFEENGFAFDLLIIEEASQAFLATLAMFVEISKCTLIIGDHKQLPPVVTLEKRQYNLIHPELSQIINGLETFALNMQQGAFRLTKTRRLTADSAKLTGLFYDNRLESISSFSNSTSNSSGFSNLFQKNGSISIVYLPFDFKTLSSKIFIQRLVELVSGLLDTSLECSVAILSSKRDMEGIMNTAFYNSGQKFDRVHFSTVHRAQGLTVDYCIFYMPLEAAHMDMNPNLFNVATSRAKRGTCIITKESLHLMTNASTEVQQYINGCANVSSAFMSFMDVEF
jgi:hypothetical protein